MNQARPCGRKSKSQLVLEWDQLAEERHRQIAAGEDLSFEHVLVPTTLDLLHGADARLVLDIGSGTGDLTKRLAPLAEHVIGVEPSTRNIVVAKENCRDIHNVRFLQAVIEDAGNALAHERPTAAVASMMLMTAPDLLGIARVLSTLLPRGSKFIATIPHPWFWPKYWAYESEDWFVYDREIYIEAPFAISHRTTTITTTHIHRPLQEYANVFSGVGFHLDHVVEPIPSPEIQTIYPRPWLYPRFIGFRWVKAE